MKAPLFIIFLVISFIGSAQNNHIVKTEDGRRVLLKADFTWEYIDTEGPKPVENVEVKDVSRAEKDKTCNVTKGFEEPKLDKKIQSQLKKGRATINHVKKKVAKDYNCEISEVLLLSFTEQRSKAVYYFCAKGTKVTYKRIGNSIVQKDKFF